jgi:hypothetical protein
MYQLKRLSPESLPAALLKAERYRLLNQPWAAESICHDILAVDPDSQPAIVLLLLCMTDQIGQNLAAGVANARTVLPRLKSEYQRTYYAGIICERRAEAQLAQGGIGSETAVSPWIREAMDWYEKAEKIRPAGNDESLLRWNTCARLLMQNPRLSPPADPVYQETLGE